MSSHPRQRKLDDSGFLPGVASFQCLLQEIHNSNINTLSSLYGRGKVLFNEGEVLKGVYILRTGRATVSISSSAGRIVILRVAEPGDLLGLNSTLCNCPYETTVKTVEPCHADFISRDELITLMERSRQGTQALLMILSRELAELEDRARILLLPQSSSARLARLLLQWSVESGVNGSRTVRIDKWFTQEDIAQMIGSSRETVTRLLSTLSRRKIIQITPDCILIRNQVALKAIVES